MSNSLYISTTEAGSGKGLVALGLLHQLLHRTGRVRFFRPVIQGTPADPGPEGAAGGAPLDEDIELIRRTFHLPQEDRDSYGLGSDQISDLMAAERIHEGLDIIISRYKALEREGDFMLCEGSDFLGEGSAFEFELNQQIARSLGCPILILGNADRRTPAEALRPVRIAVDAYRQHDCRIVGILLNKADPGQVGELNTALAQEFGRMGCTLGVIPFEQRLISPRIRDIVRHLGAEVLYGHARLDRLASHQIVAAMQMQHALDWLREGSLVITPGDRGDVIVGMLQAHESFNYPNLAGLLLTGLRPERAIERLIGGLREPLPILSVPTDTYTTVSRLREIHSPLQSGDPEKIEWGLRCFERAVDVEGLLRQVRVAAPREITPRMFDHNLMQQARGDRQRIVLPESQDPRVLQATARILAQGLATPILLGEPAEIDRVIQQQGIDLDLSALEIITPSSSPSLDAYAHSFVALRRHKGATLDIAHDHMLDATSFATMMVVSGDADGMVSGATHTTQQTIRPALQLIKAGPGIGLISSIFLMYLEDRVLIYGDCAVNPRPNAEQLAQIAISSAESARAFGLEPRVAMLSYSSGDSGKGKEVEKVRQATRRVRDLWPDLAVEGPIQYDAAVSPDVAHQKLPESAVGGRSTVLIFPDLNTGNNTYKAVQRETGAVAIGPILQGLRKPVNDLSRGCSVEDIVHTVVVTAIQAQQASSPALHPRQGGGIAAGPAAADGDTLT